MDPFHNLAKKSPSKKLFRVQKENSSDQTKDLRIWHLFAVKVTVASKKVKLKIKMNWQFHQNNMRLKYTSGKLSVASSELNMDG